jgi:Tfp pilus assembly protein PilO
MNAALQQFLTFARRNPIMVASISIIVLMGSASYFLWQRQQDLTGQHDEIRRNGEDILSSLTSHVRITQEIASVTDALNFIDHNLVNEADLAENLGYFYQIETASRLRFSQVNQLSSQPQPPGSAFKPVPFMLRATGTFRQIIRLVHELESGPRLLRIRTFTVSTSEGAAEAPRAGPGPGGAVSEPTDLVTIELNVELLGHP